MWTLQVPYLWGRVFVAVDAHSKWLEVEIVPSASTAVTVSKLRSMFTTHGLPHILVSDNGAAFTSLEFKQFLKQNGIRHLTSTPYHPATNGMVERYVQTFKVALKKGSDNDLLRELSIFLFRYRTTPYSTTGISPAQLLMGRPLKTHLDFLRPDLASKVREAQVTHDQKSHFHLFQVGDQVFIRNFVVGPKWLAGTGSTIIRSGNVGWQSSSQARGSYPDPYTVPDTA